MWPMCCCIYIYAKYIINLLDKKEFSKCPSPRFQKGLKLLSVRGRIIAKGNYKSITGNCRNFTLILL